MAAGYAHNAFVAFRKLSQRLAAFKLRYAAALGLRPLHVIALYCGGEYYKVAIAYVLSIVPYEYGNAQLLQSFGKR